MVVSTLQRGFGAGWRVSLAPLLADVPVVLVGVLVASALSTDLLNAMAIGGGTVVAALGAWTIATARRVDADPGPAGPADLWKGVLVNIASPHPWLFWVVVGGPLVVAGWREAPWRGVAFLAGFYLLLVGSKVVLAWIVARTRQHLSASWRRSLVVAGGALLVAAGVALVWQGSAGRIG